MRITNRVYVLQKMLQLIRLKFKLLLHFFSSVEERPGQNPDATECTSRITVDMLLLLRSRLMAHSERIDKQIHLIFF